MTTKKAKSEKPTRSSGQRETVSDRILALAKDLEKRVDDNAASDMAEVNAVVFVLRKLASDPDVAREMVSGIREREYERWERSEAGQEFVRRVIDNRRQRQPNVLDQSNEPEKPEPDAVSLWRRVIALRDAYAKAVEDWKRLVRQQGDAPGDFSAKALAASKKRLSTLDSELARGARDHKDDRALTTTALREILNTDEIECEHAARKAIEEWISPKNRENAHLRLVAQLRVTELLRSRGETASIETVDLDALEAEDTEWRRKNTALAPSNMVGKRAKRIVDRIKMHGGSWAIVST